MEANLKSVTYIYIDLNQISSRNSLYLALYIESVYNSDIVTVTLQKLENSPKLFEKKRLNLVRQAAKTLKATIKNE